MRSKATSTPGNKRGAHDGNLMPKQAAYVTAYLQHLNGTRAAVEAGYSKASAGEMSKLLQRHPDVRAAINQGIAEREQEIKDKAARAMEHTFCQATADIGEMFDEDGSFLAVKDMPRRIRRAIASIEVEELFDGRGPERKQIGVLRKVKIHDKRASQELLVKFAGKLSDKLQVDLTKSFEQVVLEAERLRRERALEQAALPPAGDAKE